MTKEELINNLGTIARSGSKQFLEQLKDSGTSTENSSNIIGQFGVGFYSAFMVANKVEVVTKSSKAGSTGLRWTSDGAGSYEIAEVDNAEIGTTIVIHLKHECREYADEERIKCKCRINHSRLSPSEDACQTVVWNCSLQLLLRNTATLWEAQSI